MHSIFYQILISSMHSFFHLNILPCSQIFAGLVIASKKDAIEKDAIEIDAVEKDAVEKDSHV